MHIYILLFLALFIILFVILKKKTREGFTSTIPLNNKVLKNNNDKEILITANTLTSNALTGYYTIEFYMRVKDQGWGNPTLFYVSHYNRDDKEIKRIDGTARESRGNINKKYTFPNFQNGDKIVLYGERPSKCPNILGSGHTIRRVGKIIVSFQQTHNLGIMPKQVATGFNPDCAINTLQNKCDGGDIPACKYIAKKQGFSLGGGGYNFAGHWSPKGLYTYKNGRWKGMAFFGTGGTTAQNKSPAGKGRVQSKHHS